MGLVVYAMRVLGYAVEVGVDGSVLKVVGSISRVLFASPMDSRELTGQLGHLPDKGTILSSEKVFTGDSTFQEVGTIAFGTHDEHLRFSTVGSGYVETILEGAYRHGAAIWQVDGGEGKFEGATGLIVSNFLVSREGRITDHHLGVVRLR